MDLLTKSDITRIAKREAGGIHMSLFIPTHRAGSEQDPIRWKNLLVDAEDALRRAGIRRTEAAELLSHAWELHRDGLFWQHQSDGLAYFGGPAWRQFFRVPVDLPEIGAVGDRFVVGPLLRMLTGNNRFLLLALSQNRVRLLEGSKYHIDEVALRDVPTGLRDVIEPPEPRSDTMAWRASGHSPGGTAAAVFYGYGAADKDFKKTEVEQFFRRVDAGLREHLHGERIPMVLAGVDYLIPIFRGVNTYPHVLDDALIGNYDDLPPERMHEPAWEIVSEVVRREARRAIERFNERHGTGFATADPEADETAATEGRVDTLIVGAEPACWERGDAGRVVLLGGDGVGSQCERLDRSAIAALLHGGRLIAVPSSGVPGDSDMAAILRY